MRRFFTRYVLGRKPESTPGSNLRRLLSRLSCLIIVLLVIEGAALSVPEWLLWWVAGFAVYWSVFFFVIVVLAIPFLTREGFRPNPFRLFSDALISIMLSIMSFGVAYRVWGIIPPQGEVVRVFDYYYFSAVTFSTLGFGDFRPSPNARTFAGFQAIIGNLHLGIIVGAAFFAAQPSNLQNGSDNHSGDDNGNSHKS